MRRFRGCQPSWYLLIYLRETWPMQAWIHVVSWSLYFWKSVFSFRADSILKSDGDFISNWKFPDCVHFFVAWARQAVIETIAVVYKRTKRTQEMCSPYKAFFVPNQEHASAWIFGNGPVRVGTHLIYCNDNLYSTGTKQYDCQWSKVFWKLLVLVTTDKRSTKRARKAVSCFCICVV